MPILILLIIHIRSSLERVPDARDTSSPNRLPKSPIGVTFGNPGQSFLFVIRFLSAHGKALVYYCDFIRPGGSTAATF
jgi:hypothetical protein